VFLHHYPLEIVLSRVFKGARLPPLNTSPASAYPQVILDGLCGRFLHRRRAPVVLSAPANYSSRLVARAMDPFSALSPE
jgi:hypothetical protein